MIQSSFPQLAHIGRCTYLVRVVDIMWEAYERKYIELKTYKRLKYMEKVHQEVNETR